MKKILLLCAALQLVSCISTKSTIKNIDDTAKMPALSKEKTFLITEISKDRKYGYNQDYPINLGFMPIQSAEVNIARYFGALTGPKGEKITYNKIDSCCPFPSVKNEMGAGILDIYEVTWEGLKQPVKLYVNLYEKSEVMAPFGFAIRVIR